MRRIIVEWTEVRQALQRTSDNNQLLDVWSDSPHVRPQTLLRHANPLAQANDSVLYLCHHIGYQSLALFVTGSPVGGRETRLHFLEDVGHQDCEHLGYFVQVDSLLLCSIFHRQSKHLRIVDQLIDGSLEEGNRIIEMIIGCDMSKEIIGVFPDIHAQGDGSLPEITIFCDFLRNRLNNAEQVYQRIGREWIRNNWSCLRVNRSNLSMGS
jgi:hypothetical protein